MQTGNASRNEALEEIYLIFAEFYKIPTVEFYQELTGGLIGNRLSELFKIIGFNELRVNNFNIELLSFDELKEIYINCFLGIGISFALPIESVYKVWTTDPGVNMVIGNEKGYLFGDSALHMLHLYEQFQLSIPEEYSNIPDHLTLLLEFLAFLTRNYSDKDVYQLLIDHFDWLDDFNLELKKIKCSSFFVDVTELLITLINVELNRLDTEFLTS